MHSSSLSAAIKKGFQYLFAIHYHANVRVATDVYIQMKKDAMKETSGGQIIIDNTNLNARTH